MVGFSHWKGLSKNNHLGAAFALAPQKASNMMIQLLAYHRGKSLETMLNQFPTKEFDTADEYTWDVVASSRRNIPLVEVRNIANNAVTSGNIGANGEPFYLVFAEDWFADGEVIEGRYNDIYPINSGTIYESDVNGIKPSKNGDPGEKIAKIDKKSEIGTIDKNTIYGIYGYYNGKLSNIVFLEQEGYYSYTYDEENLLVEFLYTEYVKFKVEKIGALT